MKSILFILAIHVHSMLSYNDWVRILNSGAFHPGT